MNVRSVSRNLRNQLNAMAIECFDVAISELSSFQKLYVMELVLGRQIVATPEWHLMDKNVRLATSCLTLIGRKPIVRRRRDRETGKIVSRKFYKLIPSEVIQDPYAIDLFGTKEPEPVETKASYVPVWRTWGRFTSDDSSELGRLDKLAYKRRHSVDGITVFQTRVTYDITRNDIAPTKEVTRNIDGEDVTYAVPNNIRRFDNPVRRETYRPTGDTKQRVWNTSGYPTTYQARFINRTYLPHLFKAYVYSIVARILIEAGLNPDDYETASIERGTYVVRVQNGEYVKTPRRPMLIRFANLHPEFWETFEGETALATIYERIQTSKSRLVVRMLMQLAETSCYYQILDSRRQVKRSDATNESNAKGNTQAHIQRIHPVLSDFGSMITSVVSGIMYGHRAGGCKVVKPGSGYCGLRICKINTQTKNSFRDYRTEYYGNARRGGILSNMTFDDIPSANIVERDHIDNKLSILNSVRDTLNDQDRMILDSIIHDDGTTKIVDRIKLIQSWGFEVDRHQIYYSDKKTRELIANAMRSEGYAMDNNCL